MLESLLSLMAAATVAIAAFGLGRPLMRGLSIDTDDALSIGVWSTALGLVAAGLLLFALGMAGALFKPVIGILTLAAGFWGVGELSRALRLRQIRWRLARLVSGQDSPDAAPLMRASQPEASSLLPPGSDLQPPRWLQRTLFLLAGVAAAGSLIAALAPVTAGDALCYHLELPRTFLSEGAVVFLPDSDNSTFPLLVEMWYLWALALDGGVAAQLVHWGLGMLLASATVTLATPLVGRPWGWCAGCLVLLVPGITNQMTAPLNDGGLAAFTALALAAWWRAAFDEEGGGWFLVAGCMLGGALGIKYLALIFIAAAAVPCGWYGWRHPEKRRRLLVGAATVAVVAASTGGGWYMRAAWHRGNPVYPFLHAQFGGQGQPILRDSKAPLGRSPTAIASAPWSVTMQPDRFGGRGHQLGPIFLAALPGLLVCRRLRGLGLLLGIAAGYLVGWCFLRQNVRFLFPLVPLLAIAVTWVWIELARLPRVPALLATALLLLLASVGSAVAAARARDKAAVALGIETRERFLLRSEPTYQAAWWANTILPPESSILSQEHRAFYFQARMTRENLYRHRTHYDREVTTPAELSRRLRADGFTHLLLAESISDDGIHYNSTLSRLAGAPTTSAAGGALTFLVQYDFQDTDGAVRRYRLVALR